MRCSSMLRAQAFQFSLCSVAVVDRHDDADEAALADFRFDLDGSGERIDRQNAWLLSDSGRDAA